MKNYNVAIIGGGIGGLMSAYRLCTANPNCKIILFEKGHDIEKRSCPIVTGKAKTCIKCESCGIMEGLAGAGAFSDGKYIISTEYGGWLPDFLPKKTVLDYIEKADAVMMSFGAPAGRFMPSDELKKKCLEYDLHMSQAQLKHLGTDANFETMRHMSNFLKERVEIVCDTDVYEIDKEKNTVYFHGKDGDDSISADNIIVAVGRAGSRFFSQWCKSHDIVMTNNQVDIGVRVELPASVWQDFSEKIYEPKIWYRSKKYGDITRMFCFNEKGNVVMENTQGVLTVNGHAYKDPAKKTENSNFALLSTIRFTEPFKEPIEYARHVATLSNLISGGSVLVQRLGDLMNGRRTDAKRLSQSTVVPTLNAVPGDLSLCVPKRQLDNIIETLEALDKIAPGTMNYDTLLYGIECKYYSARPETDEDFQLKGCKGIYCVGDGTGFTRSLSQAAAHGIYVADMILKDK
ncbi:MAG: NAD(P)-binding protein [Oscillospiraceae bacterium]